jgi:hypothetical protein
MKPWGWPRGEDEPVRLTYREHNFEVYVTHGYADMYDENGPDLQCWRLLFPLDRVGPALVSEILAAARDQAVELEAAAAERYAKGPPWYRAFIDRIRPERRPRHGNDDVTEAG